MSSQNLRLNFIGRNIDFIGKLENRSEKKNVEISHTTVQWFMTHYYWWD